MSEYYIFSFEHGAWWMAGRRGYTKQLSKAGVYSRIEALQICTKALPGTASRMGAMPELPVPVADVAFIRDAFLAEYAIASGEPWL